jgi:hypothetical protein
MPRGWDVLVLDVGGEDVLYGDRGSCTNCPVVRALRRWLTAGEWSFDGEVAVNPMYGTFGLLQKVGYDGGAGAIARFDAGSPLTARRLVLVRCDS